MMLRRQHSLLLDTVLLGIVGALSAQAFVFLLRLCQTLFLGWIAGFRYPHLAAETAAPGVPAGYDMWLIPLATTLGGLVAGVLVYSLAPEAEGHGTDTVVNAFHHLGGMIRARVPLVKLVASAVTIGSGGSAGREGPTALISAGFASAYAAKRGRTEDEKRLLMLVGMAAGLAAIFRSPIGTAIFAVEVLYSETEFETGALVFTMLGSIVAYSVNGLFVGFEPLFAVPAKLAAPTAVEYGLYALLGVFCGLVATILPVVFYGVRDIFRRLPCPAQVKPAIGGLAVGLVAMFLPQLLAGGYDSIQAAINGGLGTRLLLLLAFGKIVTFALTIGSGGSGGVFAPSLFTGAMVGGFLSQMFHLPPAGYVVVGMAAVFGAAARVPIATMLMVSEMTGGYQLLVAAALAVMLSSLVQKLLSSSLKYQSLYEAQVPTRPQSPAHYVQQVRIALDLLRSHAISTLPKDRGLELLSLLASGVPITVGEGNRIRIGVLRPKSPCVGQSIESPCLGGRQAELEFVLVLRGDRVLWPNAELNLEAGDQIVLLASDGAWQDIASHFTTVAQSSRKTSPLGRQGVNSG
jgi:CIC family chloride channel protein